MDEGIAQAVADWETRPFSGGYGGLRDLADASFSGAVEADGTWCLFINGRAVGVYDEYGRGDDHEQEPVDVDRFEGASGTVHEAPHDSLPLLFAMQLQDGELVARHPTSDRPLAEMHRELSDQGFTGYLELSEHVLSGDYYVVYQGGRSMNAAFIGNARRLKTGDEAFERATTEVGVYEVYATPIDVVDIPEPAGADATGPGAGAAAGGSAAAADADPGTVDGEPADADHGSVDDEPADADHGSVDDEPADAVELSADEGNLDPIEPVGTGATDADRAATESPGDADRPATDPDGDPAAPATEPPGEPTTESAEPATEPADPVDPATEPEPAEPTEPADAAAEPTTEPEPTEPDAGGASEEREEPEQGPPTATNEPSTERAAPSGRAAGGVAAAEVEELAERIDALANQHEELAERVERLDTLLSDLVMDGDEAFAPEERRSAEEALVGTTLLVRYDAESGPKLADVVEGTISDEALAENLRFEPRTTFPAGETAVDGEPYGAFLDEALAPRFVEWLVGDLPFEIRRANATKALGPLYEALPSVDRATFGTEAALEGHAFDVTLRTRDGDPVAVARIETDTDPPEEGTYEDLVRAATEVHEAHPSLAGAFLVTAGYVDGAELDPVREATRDRVLSRSKRESYVSLSGGGFHLCVVEAGSEAFHLEVPGL